MYGGNNASIDDLLDRAVRAGNSGDHVTATALAGQVLAVDHGNHDAEDLLDCFDRHGEIRRLAMMFIDLVDSTVAVDPDGTRELPHGGEQLPRRGAPGWSTSTRATSRRPRVTGCSRCSATPCARERHGAGGIGSTGHPARRRADQCAVAAHVRRRDQRAGGRAPRTGLPRHRRGRRLRLRGQSGLPDRLTGRARHRRGVGLDRRAGGRCVRIGRAPGRARQGSGRTRPVSPAGRRTAAVAGAVAPAPGRPRARTGLAGTHLAAGVRRGVDDAGRRLPWRAGNRQDATRAGGGRTGRGLRRGRHRTAGLTAAHRQRSAPRPAAAGTSLWHHPAYRRTGTVAAAGSRGLRPRSRRGDHGATAGAGPGRGTRTRLPPGRRRGPDAVSEDRRGRAALRAGLPGRPAGPGDRRRRALVRRLDHGTGGGPAARRRWPAAGGAHRPRRFVASIRLAGNIFRARHR